MIEFVFEFLRARSMSFVVFFTVIMVSLGCDSQPNQKESERPVISSEDWNKMHDVKETSPWKVKFDEREKWIADSLRQQCSSYWKQMDSLNAMKVKFFEERILNAAINNSDVSDANKDFLKALFKELKQPWSETRKIPFYQRALVPVFSLEEGQRSVIELSVYEYDLLQEAKKGIQGIDTLGTFRFPELFQKLESKTDLGFYAFTENGKTTVKLQHFSYFISECDDRFSFGLDNSNLNSDDKVMFLSKFPLDLEFKSSAEIDQLWESQHKYFCYDCVFEFEPRTVFAKLSGVENVYFTYTDTFPLNTGFKFPQRAIMMQMGDSFVDLWSEEVDLFGCSCL